MGRHPRSWRGGVPQPCAMVEQVAEYAIFAADLDGRPLSWNRGVQKNLGFEAEDFIGHDVIPLIYTPEDLATGVPGRELQAAAAVGVADNTRWMRRRTGERFYASGVTTAVRDADGAVVGFTKVLRDASATKRLRDALAASELRYRRLFESSNDGLLLLDVATGRILEANAFTAALLGLEPGDLVGRALHEVGLLPDRDHAEEALAALRRVGFFRAEHLSLTHRLEQAVEVEVVCTAYREDHQVVVQCNVRDIGERIALQARIREQSEAIAAESRRKDEFLAMLGHELRNPLAPIRAAVHLLERAAPASESPLQRQAREVIARQVATMTRLVDDLLDVARVTSGRIRLDRRTLDLNEVLGRAVQTCGPQIGDRGHEVRVHTSGRPVWVDGDPTRLEEVLVNLVDNAAKYTPDGGHLELWCDVDRDGAARVRVRDDGVGVDAELLPRIFDLFSQADRSLARSAGGLGIGLSLSRRLVELHGGRLEVRSPPPGSSRGTEFVVVLPLAEAPNLPRLVPPPPADDRHASGLRVLVVDDNTDLVSMVLATLTEAGHVVRTSHDGAQGLALATRWRPDVVLLDIGLPVLDGYEVARRIRASPDPALRRTRLVALTGYGGAADVRRAMDAGFDAHLVKPCDMEQLEEVLRSGAEQHERIAG